MHSALLGHLFICTLILVALFLMVHSPIYSFAEFTSVAYKPPRIL